MRLYSTSDSPDMFGAHVFANSRWFGSLFSLCFLLSLAAPLAAIWHFFDSRWVTWPATFVAALILPSILRTLVRYFRRSNWVLAIDGNRILLNLRSIFNQGFDEALTVLELGMKEVNSVRQVEVSLPASASSGSTYRQTSLEIELSPEFDSTPVDRALCEERQRLTPRSGLFRSRGRVNHCPVTLLQSSRLRIIWKGKMTSVSPSIDQALQFFDSRLRREESATDVLPDWRTVSDAELDDLILNLILNNERLTAISIIRKRRNLSLEQARKFVDSLLS